MDRPDSEKHSKTEVDYGLGGRDHCGVCRYFLPVPQRVVGSCYQVKGPIRAQDWCKLFASTRAPLTTVKEKAS